MNKKILIIVSVLLILLLAGAGFLYKGLSADNAPDALATMPQETEPAMSEATGTQTEAAEDNRMLAPDFTAYDKEGNEVKLSDFIGKPIVLNFWASWCGPCKMEMPEFQAKFEELGDEVQFLLVNMTDGKRETVEIASAFVEDKGYTLPVYYDTAFSAARTYGVTSLPTTYFIDSEGYLVAQARSAIQAETLQRGIDMIFN